MNSDNIPICFESDSEPILKNQKDLHLNDSECSNEIEQATVADETNEEEFWDVSEDIVTEHVQLVQPISVLINNENSSDESNILNKLIQRQKHELGLELRRLQYGDRPVTSSETKSRIRDFFSGAMVSENSSTLSSSYDNASAAANISSVPSRTFRSSTILNEISELGSQQRVSQLLMTNRELFERSLQRLANTNPLALNNSVSSAVSVSNQPQRQRVSVSAAQSIQDQRAPYLETINTSNPIQEIAREQIISEISELVHTQLVTNALQNDEFRSNLERRVLDSLRRSGTDGQQTRQSLRQLALNVNNRIQRNDFSHLGIMSGQQPTDENLSDSASVASHVISRHTTTVIHNSREIKELKSEISELKNMLKLSFEITLDMQRTFRQEISALIAGTLEKSTSASLSRSQPSNEGKCVICTEENIDSVLYACGHMCSCFKCSYNLKQKGHNCPVCRAPIKDVLRAYRSNID